MARAGTAVGKVRYFAERPVGAFADATAVAVRDIRREPIGGHP